MSTNIENTNELNPDIKRRGRKPKINNIVSEEISEKQLIKKRGRKANPKIINLDNNVNYEIISNLVAHLPLKYTDINKIMTNSDTTNNIEINTCDKNIIIEEDNTCIKINIKSCEDCKLCQIKISQLNEDIQKLKNGIFDMKTNFNKKIYESKVNFLNKDTNLWNETTNISCWWCCHKFDNIPVGIPEYIITNKNTYYLFGCFCSFNCMMAYNIDLNDNKIWERQANIYQLKNKIDPENKISIHPAPPRQTLEMFGGLLSINEYRQTFFVLNREYRHIYPPMISIIGVIEEINRDISGVTKIKIDKSSDNLIIKRKKPLIKQSNNLNYLII